MGNNPHVNIEEVVKDPVYLDDEDFSKVKNFKRIAVKTFKVKRISKGRLLLKKEIMQNFGLKKERLGLCNDSRRQNNLFQKRVSRLSSKIQSGIQTWISVYQSLFWIKFQKITV